MSKIILLNNKVEIDIEKAIFPDHGELLLADEDVCAVIIDMELDPIKCSFEGGDCVVIETKEYSHVTLSIDNLKQIIKLIKQAEKYLNNK